MFINGITIIIGLIIILMIIIILNVMKKFNKNYDFIIVHINIQKHKPTHTLKVKERTYYCGFTFQTDVALVHIVCKHIMLFLSTSLTHAYSRCKLAVSVSTYLTVVVIYCLCSFFLLFSITAYKGIRNNESF